MKNKSFPDKMGIYLSIFIDDDDDVDIRHHFI
jgi:hypothetical protein